MNLYLDMEKCLGSFHLCVKLEAADETTALLGASGCGKSMTLKCIAGIERPDRGRIVLDDTVLFDSERHIDLPPQKRRVGYLFQQYALFPSMTAAQNIRCAIRGGSRAEKAALLAEFVRRFRLEGLEKKLPAQLSGGQQQCVALARILAAQPRAILLDEPFSALDGFLKWSLELELADLLADFDGPIVWVSHDPGECRRNCSRVCVMEAGTAGVRRPMAELAARPDSLSAARLAGYKNFLAAERRGTDVFLPQWDLTIPALSAPADAFTLCSPPEAVVFTPVGEKWRVRRVIEDLRASVVLLQLERAAETAPFLRAELPPAKRRRKARASAWRSVQSGSCRCKKPRPQL